MLTKSFNFKASKDGQCGYSSEQENANTLGWSNGITVRGKLKSKLLQAHVDFPRKALAEGATVVPYVRFEVCRNTSSVTPFIGGLFRVGDFKWNGLFQLVDKSVSLKHRAEFLRYQSGFRLHFALSQGINLSEFGTTTQKALLSVQKDKVEGAVRVGREGRLDNLDYVDVGAVYLDKDLVDVSAQLRVDPANVKSPKDLWVGVGKRFAPNLYVKARTNLFSGVATYYAAFVANSNTSVAATLDVNHCKEKAASFQGCCSYPFNFGVKLSFNA